MASIVRRFIRPCSLRLQDRQPVVCFQDLDTVSAISPSSLRFIDPFICRPGRT
nr:MAG TPA: hypothetical protein [Caudoviricetes sp.]